MYAAHPMTVHFPLALLLASGIFTLVYLRWGEQAWEASAYHCLLVGWLAGLFALASGLFAVVRLLGQPTGLPPGAIGWVNAHAFFNVAVMVVYGQALQMRRRNPQLLADSAARRGYLLRHLLGALLLVVGGWLGGHMVYTLYLR
ncbi:MAG: DUF2231 domain-containing protein [Oscillochloris sp.]|nr:DUF2231 domain-containing protein [Oscillochloris sp.]